MKKVISIIIALVFVMSSSLAFASNGKSNNGSGKGNNGKYKYTSKVNYEKELKKLKDLLKKYIKDSDKRDDVIDDILDLKDKNYDNTTSIFINGVEYSTSEAPVIKYGNILLPTKPITNGLGAKLVWNASTKTVTITKGNVTLVMRLDKKTITINGAQVKNSVLTSTKKNKTIILIKYIAQILGNKAEVDEDSNAVIVENDGSTSINDSIIGKGINQFEFKGIWSYGSQTGAFLEDNHWSSTKNAYYRVRFTGTQIKLYGAVSPKHGIAAVSIDGGPEVNIDFYAANRADNALVYTSPVLMNGQHTLKVRVTGTRNSSSSSNSITADRVNVVTNTTSIPDATNLALNKNAFSDSVQPENTASKANDGNTSTRWSASDGGFNHWWTVDLGNYYNISGSEVMWEQNNKVYRYKVEVSADNNTWTLKADKTNNSSSQQTQTDSYTANAVRFVRITITGMDSGSWASMYEFKVFGSNYVSDTQAPAVPTALVAAAPITSEVALNWNASTDNVGVAGYKVFRNGTQVGTVTSGTSYRDTGLSAGTPYVYAVSAYDAAGNSSTQCVPVVVTTPLTNGSGTGLKGEYYNNTDFTDLKLSRVDSTVDFDWNYNAPNSAMGADTFSVRWTGQIQPLYSETYTFYTNSDDGVRLWVNGQKIIDNWTDHDAMQNSGTITLVAGQKYDIKLEYYENNSEAEIKLSWSSNSQAKQIIPKSQLYPAEIDAVAPTVPANLTAAAISSSQVNLNWTASTDNVGVTGYKIYRNGTQIGNVTTGTAYSDTGLTANTPYVYAVLAYDASGNSSAQCSPIVVSTLVQSNYNLAINKTASSDSEEAANPASKGNDGSTSTRWCAADGSFNHWWKVDLGALHNITGTEVTWEFGKVYKYKVEVSQDNTNWTLVLDKTNNASTQQTQTESFTANNARYVRITVTGFESGCWASFYEFKVIGN